MAKKKRVKKNDFSNRTVFLTLTLLIVVLLIAMMIYTTYLDKAKSTIADRPLEELPLPIDDVTIEEVSAEEIVDDGGP
jgi:flagellar basal body-associated protein FliL